MNRRSAAVAAVVVALWWWLRPFRAAVRGASMRPVLDDGDFVVAVRPRRLRRGDVVVVRRPGGLEVVKRVVGLPGEEVAVGRGRVSVGGARLAEPYASGEGPPGSWTLGRGEYVVLGDDRSHSTDARAFGAVRRDAVRGVVVFRYWPRPRLL